MSTQYPEHEKLKAVKVESQAIGQFLDSSPYVLCEPNPDSLIGSYRAVITPIVEILAEHFKIDLTKIEQEKRAMLASIMGDGR